MHGIAASLFGHFQVVNRFTASNKLITSSPIPVNNAINIQSYQAYPAAISELKVFSVARESLWLLRAEAPLLISPGRRKIVWPNSIYDKEWPHCAFIRPLDPVR